MSYDRTKGISIAPEEACSSGCLWRERYLILEKAIKRLRKELIVAIARNRAQVSGESPGEDEEEEVAPAPFLDEAYDEDVGERFSKVRE